MKWVHGGWAAILYGVLTLRSAHAEPVRPMPAQLGLPAETETPSRDVPAVSKTAGKVKAMPSDSNVSPVAAQGEPAGGGIERLVPVIPIGFPKREQLFRLRSEERFFAKIKEEMESRKVVSLFPEPLKLTDITVIERGAWPTAWCIAEPNYVCHSRLWFEQRAFERDGWYIGILQSPVSALLFYTDILKLPVYWALDPCRDFECNAGLCLPGDPSPLRWYLRVK